jgi:hypothetical protein
MATATDSKILLTTKNQQLDAKRCCICGKKLRLIKTTENPLTCWQCMILNKAILAIDAKLLIGEIIVNEHGAKESLQARPGTKRCHIGSARRGAKAGTISGKRSAHGSSAQKVKADLAIRTFTYTGCVNIRSSCN